MLHVHQYRACDEYQQPNSSLVSDSSDALRLCEAYLETRASSQRTPQFHHCAADFVSYGNLAAMMLDWGTSCGVIVVCAFVLAASHHASSW